MEDEKKYIKKKVRALRPRASPRNTRDSPRRPALPASSEDTEHVTCGPFCPPSLACFVPLPVDRRARHPMATATSMPRRVHLHQTTLDSLDPSMCTYRRGCTHSPHTRSRQPRRCLFGKIENKPQKPLLSTEPLKPLRLILKRSKP